LFSPRICPDGTKPLILVLGVRRLANLKHRRWEAERAV
jgi:hypothetical protein